MKKPFLPVHKILIATFAGISFASFLVAQPSLADTEQPFSSLETDRNANSLFGNGSDFNMFELMHRAQFGPLNWNQQEQNQQLNDAAAAFRAKQRKLWLQQQPSTSSPTINGENAAPLMILPADK
ncbi:hypothetical protein WJM97_09070 [Okeanomitos corallinicola TIOX110]|uniref:Uncharacterized protein n=1 Tax=Okeanomitos corallinicola TIOX110 TaxID=3133117 RepID=A0ABZ2UWM8_9CYAN